MMFGFRDQFIYFECANCGCIQIKELPSNLSKYYPKNYYSFTTADGNFLKEFLIRQRDKYALGFGSLIGKALLKRYPVPLYIKFFNNVSVKLNSRILDVGSGNGSMLLTLRKLGFSDLTGIDPFIACDVKYKNGISILKRSIFEIDREYDLVIFNHSLEHMPNPVEVLKEISTRLRENAQVIIRIPNASSYAWRKYKENWVALDAPRHLFIPTTNSMEHLVESTGFILHKLYYDSYSFQFWASEQYQNDIPLMDPRSYNVNPKRSIFDQIQIQRFTEISNELNEQKKGDQACYILKKNLDN